jgi:hypothetical protein
MKSVASRLPLAIALLPLMWLLPPLRHAVESSMLLHMLLQFPLLLLSGVMAGRWLARAWPALDRGVARVDALGLLGATSLLLVSGFWMVPAALDLALLDARYAGFKYLSWWGCGVLLALGTPRYSPVMAVFTFGNLAWMMASAGLLYQSIDVPLCVSYLQNEQVWTGRGLIAFSLLLGPWLLLRDGKRCLSEAAAAALPPPSGQRSPSPR